MNKDKNYFELRIKINPEIAEILSDICFENFDCEGVVLAEETYKDDLVLVSTTEETLKVYLKSVGNVAEVLTGKVGLPAHKQGLCNISDTKQLENHVQQILTEQRQLLLNRGLSEKELGSWEFVIDEIENQDWSKKWKENWDVTHVSKNIAVVPSWIEYEPKKNELGLDEVIITLDPGTAFGTGTHATTQLCMRATEKYMPKGAKMADIGTGSGILAICGAKLRAEGVYGCDNDELVIGTAIENAKINNVSDKCVFECNTTDKLIKRFSNEFNFVTANILHNVLADIMGELKAIMADNAVLVLSGILDEKKQVVLDAINKQNLQLIEEIHQDIWVAFVVSNKLNY